MLACIRSGGSPFRKERGVQEENKAVVRRIIEEFLNSGDPDLAGELFHPDFVDHTPSNPDLGGLQNVKRSVADWHEAFPDTVNVVEELIAEGDMVAARWVTRGTHRGEFMELAPTGRSIEVGSSGIFRTSGGKVVESWDHFDALGMLEQLGAAPKPKSLRSDRHPPGSR